MTICCILGSAEVLGEPVRERIAAWHGARSDSFAVVLGSSGRGVVSDFGGGPSSDGPRADSESLLQALVAARDALERRASGARMATRLVLVADAEDADGIGTLLALAERVVAPCGPWPAGEAPSAILCGNADAARDDGSLERVRRGLRWIEAACERALLAAATVVACSDGEAQPTAREREAELIALLGVETFSNAFAERARSPSASCAAGVSVLDLGAIDVSAELHGAYEAELLRALALPALDAVALPSSHPVPVRAAPPGERAANESRSSRHPAPRPPAITSPRAPLPALASPATWASAILCLLAGLVCGVWAATERGAFAVSQLAVGASLGALGGLGAWFVVRTLAARVPARRAGALRAMAPARSAENRPPPQVTIAASELARSEVEPSARATRPAMLAAEGGHDAVAARRASWRAAMESEQRTLRSPPGELLERIAASRGVRAAVAAFSADACRHAFDDGAFLAAAYEAASTWASGGSDLRELSHDERFDPTIRTLVERVHEAAAPAWPGGVGALAMLCGVTRDARGWANEGDVEIPGAARVIVLRFAPHASSGDLRSSRLTRGAGSLAAASRTPR